MNLYGAFQDIKGNVWHLEISAPTGADPAAIDDEGNNIRLGGTPAIIASASSGLISSIKSRGMTIEIYTTEWYPELYDPTARGTYVKLYQTVDEEEVVYFRGYLTPCEYDQSFTYVDTIQLEAVDAISTCKDFKWNNDGQYHSFLDIIFTILNNDTYGYRGKLYVPKSYIKINDDDITDDILNKLYASSANFIDDDEAHTPWKEYEVLEEIMKFLGWSLCPFGDDIWLIDYRAENLGSVDYAVYDIRTRTLEEDQFTSPMVPTSITLANMAAGESQISIDDIYNKIEISDNLYKIDEISPDIFDDSQHISVTDEAGIGVEKSKWEVSSRKQFLWWTYDHETDDGYDYQTLCRLKPESGWTHYYYRMSDMSPVNNEDGKGYFNQATAESAEQVNWTGSRTIQKVNTHGCLLQHYAFIDESHPNNVPTSIDWTNILTFFVTGPTSTPVPISQLNNRLVKKVLEYNVSENIQWKPTSGKSWVTLKGDLWYQIGCDYKDGKRRNELTIVNTSRKWYCTTPLDKSMNNLPSDYNYGGPLCSRSDSNPLWGKGFNLWKMALHIGDKAWNGTIWVDDTNWRNKTDDQIVTFHIPYNNSPTGDDDEYLPAFKWMSMVSNTTYKDQVGEDCYAIPIDSEKAGDPTFGQLTLTIFTPCIFPQELLDAYIEWLGKQWGAQTISGFGNLAPCIFCKGFELGYIYTDTSVWWNNHDDNNDTDKVYIGYIDDDYVQNFDKIEFKLNTSLPDKPIARSYVAANYTINNNTKTGYLATLKHSAGDVSKEQEYNVVDLYLDHHSERKVVYDRNMHNLFKPYEKFNKSQFNGVLMIDKYSFDVRNDNNSIKFIEF